MNLEVIYVFFFLLPVCARSSILNKMESVDLDHDLHLQQGTIQISRPVFTHQQFNKIYPPKQQEELSGIDHGKKLLQKFNCSYDMAKRLLFYILPSLHWVPKYKIREYLVHDVITGLTIGVVNIPQGRFNQLFSVVPFSSSSSTPLSLSSSLSWWWWWFIIRPTENCCVALNCRCCYFQTPFVVHCMNATTSAQSPKF